MSISHKTLCFYSKNPSLTKVFGYNAKEKILLLHGKVKIIRIKLKKVFLFELKI
jgi:hypothetical protein